MDIIYNTPIEVLNAQRKLGTETAETMTLLFEMLNSGVSSARVLGVDNNYIPAALMDRGIKDAIWYSEDTGLDHIIENHPLVRKTEKHLHTVKSKKSDLVIVDAKIFNEASFPDRWLRGLFKRSANKYVVFYNVNTNRANKDYKVKVELENIVTLSLPEFELWRQSQHNFGILVFKRK